MLAELRVCTKRTTTVFGFSLKTCLPKIVHGRFKIETQTASCTSKKRQNVIDAIVLRIGRLNGRITALDQVHARSFLNMGRSLLHVSGMNQQAFERLKIKDKRLDALSELPRTFFL
jgi:hypothetical protein